MQGLCWVYFISEHLIVLRLLIFGYSPHLHSKTWLTRYFGVVNCEMLETQSGKLCLKYQFLVMILTVAHGYTSEIKLQGQLVVQLSTGSAFSRPGNLYCHRKWFFLLVTQNYRKRLGDENKQILLVKIPLVQSQCVLKTFREQKKFKTIKERVWHLRRFRGLRDR